MRYAAHFAIDLHKHDRYFFAKSGAKFSVLAISIATFLRLLLQSDHENALFFLLTLFAVALSVRCAFFFYPRHFVCVCVSALSLH